MKQHESEELTEVRHLIQRIDRHINVFVDIENEGEDVAKTKELKLSKATVDIIKASVLLEHYSTLLTQKNSK
jgi:hypothetical protein